MLSLQFLQIIRCILTTDDIWSYNLIYLRYNSFNTVCRKWSLHTRFSPFSWTITVSNAIIGIRLSLQAFSPGVSLTPCCFVVYFTRRFVVCLSVCHFVLVFSSPFSIAITSLGEESYLNAFRTFVRFVLV